MTWHIRVWVLLLALPLLMGLAQAQQPKLPGQAEQLLPQLREQIDMVWPDLLLRPFPAGVISQESNWKPTARLKTHREFGCGLGQHTIAWNADGSVRFDSMAEMKALDPALRGWNLEDCYNVTYQLRATVLKLRMNDRGCEAVMENGVESLKCAAAKYNGGAGSVAKRIRACRATPNCNAGIWEQNLATQCPQSRVKVQGYGESFCDINSKYPGRVFKRMEPFAGRL